jgi:hypothetical protein
MSYHRVNAPDMLTECSASENLILDRLREFTALTNDQRGCNGVSTGDDLFSRRDQR